MSQDLMVVAEVGVEENELTRRTVHCWRNSSVSLGDDFMSFKPCVTSSLESSLGGHLTRIRQVVSVESMLDD